MSKYLIVAVLQRTFKVSHLSVEVNYGNLLLEHLTVQLHLFQETDVQLPEWQETGIRR